MWFASSDFKKNMLLGLYRQLDLPLRNFMEVLKGKYRKEKYRKKRSIELYSILECQTATKVLHQRMLLLITSLFN